MAGITACALRTVSILTCRPAFLNRPFACAIYRPALASAGTVATTMFGFSGAPGLPEPAAPVELTLLPHAAAVTAIPVTTAAAKTRRHDRRRRMDPAIAGLAGTARSAEAAGS